MTTRSTSALSGGDAVIEIKNKIRIKIRITKRMKTDFIDTRETHL
jgi:hypothetical protein